ncbi:hypothetical protein [Burkholderia sp. TSV86]|uniref:hypothetical protein n=1 Tax=Burkholderia sp. TSV86 TaxID=1385594 RepID=UPI000A432993|nr:hypothetical protein [Burkholderia sp. TSV86]
MPITTDSGNVTSTFNQFNYRANPLSIRNGYTPSRLLRELKNGMMQRLKQDISAQRLKRESAHTHSAPAHLEPDEPEPAPPPLHVLAEDASEEATTQYERFVDLLACADEQANDQHSEITRLFNEVEDVTADVRNDINQARRYIQVATVQLDSGANPQHTRQVIDNAQRNLNQARERLPQARTLIDQIRQLLQPALANHNLFAGHHFRNHLEDILTNVGQAQRIVDRAQIPPRKSAAARR